MIFIKNIYDCVIDMIFKAWKRLTLQQAMYVNVDCDEEKVEASKGKAQFGDGGGLAYYAFAPTYFHHVDFAQRDLQLGFFVVEEECTCVYGHRGWW